MGLEEAAAVLGVVGSLAGTGASIYGADQTQNAENNAAEQALNQQTAFAKQGQGIFNNAVQQNTAPVAKQQVDTGAADALAKYTQTQQGQAAPNLSSMAADPLAQARTAQVIGQSDKAGSQLQGFGNLDLQRSLQNLGTNFDLSKLGSLSGFAGGTLGPMMQQASQAGAGANLAGGALSTLGSLAGGYANSNKSQNALNGILNNLQLLQGGFNNPNYNTSFNAGSDFVN